MSGDDNEVAAFFTYNGNTIAQMFRCNGGKIVETLEKEYLNHLFEERSRETFELLKGSAIVWPRVAITSVTRSPIFCSLDPTWATVTRT